MESEATMTDYERRRLENIKRNDQMLEALNIRSKLTQLCPKRQSVQSKSYTSTAVKKPKTETPAVLRRSLRARGVPPANGVDRVEKTIEKYITPREQGHLEFRVDGKLVETIWRCSRDYSSPVLCYSIDSLARTQGSETYKTGKFTRKKGWGAVNAAALQLKSENIIARLVPGKITSLKFFPTREMQMIAFGNVDGVIGLWHVDDKEEDGGGIYLYHPHSQPVSGIVIDWFSISKIYNSCHDGFIKLMEAEKGVNHVVHRSEYCIYSLSQSAHDTKALYFSEGEGRVNKLDVRSGKSCLSCDVHQGRINTIDFNTENENLMATSSSDGTASIWDLRLMSRDNTTPLTTVSYEGAVQSAYFSPSGKILATSFDSTVDLLSGANYENTCMVHHGNMEDKKRIFSSRGIWGWDDSCIWIGNRKKAVDVISVGKKGVVATLESDLMPTVPRQLDAHPYNLGMLACAASAGQVYIWTQP